jgi:hypothetical protein
MLHIPLPIVARRTGESQNPPDAFVDTIFYIGKSDSRGKHHSEILEAYLVQ